MPPRMRRTLAHVGLVPSGCGHPQGGGGGCNVMVAAYVGGARMARTSGLGDVAQQMEATAGLWEDAARRMAAAAAGAPTHSEAAANRAHAEALRECAAQLRGFAQAVAGVAVERGGPFREDRTEP